MKSSHRLLYEGAKELNAIIGGKQLFQIGTELARQAVYAKKKIQDAILAIDNEEADFERRAKERAEDPCIEEDSQ